jgi:hypothetical protein
MLTNANAAILPDNEMSVLAVLLFLSQNIVKL